MLRDPSVIPEDFSVDSYFMYSKTGSTNDLASMPDACQFLSSLVFAGNAEVQQCMVPDTPDVCVLSGTGGSDKCRIGQTTFSYEQSIQTNIIDKFEVSDSVALTKQEREAQIALVDLEVVKKYNDIKTCTGPSTRTASPHLAPVRTWGVVLSWCV